MFTSGAFPSQIAILDTTTSQVLASTAIAETDVTAGTFSQISVSFEPTTALDGFQIRISCASTDDAAQLLFDSVTASVDQVAAPCSLATPDATVLSNSCFATFQGTAASAVTCFVSCIAGCVSHRHRHTHTHTHTTHARTHTHTHTRTHTHAHTHAHAHTHNF